MIMKKSLFFHKLFHIVAVMAILGAAFPFQPAVPVAQAASPNIVISQVYGGGGNSGATYKNDFIELFNLGSTSVNLSGWSVQYASSTGTTWQVTNLSAVMLQPGQYYLVQEAQGSGGTVNLPTPDATGIIPMSASAGKVALVNNTTALTGSCPTVGVVDFVGFGTANCYEGSGPTPAPSNTTAVLRASGGCKDTDVNSADFTSSTPTPRNTASAINVCSVAETAPQVTSTSPTNGASGVPVNQDLSVTFSEPVNLTSAWFSLSCSLSGTWDTSNSTISGGAAIYTINPNADLSDGDSCTLTIFANQVSDQDTNDPPDTMTADVLVNFSVQDVCSLSYTPVYQIQGSGLSAAITSSVTTQGIVVGDYEGASPALQGFYLQDLTGDGNLATSDGIFIFESDNGNRVNLGDVVRVTGTVSEYFEQTQVGASTVHLCSSGNSIAPVEVTFPLPGSTYLEQYEGMLVRLPQTMYVTEHFQLGRFGQVVVSSGARLQQPTNVALPGAPALAIQGANDLNRLIIDDALNNQNPDPILFGRGGIPLSASNTLRGGDSVTGVVGVMTYTWSGNSASGNAYRLRPINALGGGSPDFQAINSRPATAPALQGSLRVAGMNLLNYFNTFGSGACTNGVGGSTTDCRGADTLAEFDRQWPKTVAAITGTQADIIGVVEIENDGYGPTSAIADLVNKLNNATAPGTYAFIDVDASASQVNALGSDAIKVGLIYKPARVNPVGITAALNTTAFVNGGDSAARNRPALAQAFEEITTGQRFVLAVNHFKSKGSACDIPDAGDGQGECNLVRINAANQLTAWLATDPTGSGDPDVLIIGDLNSYAKEDPILAIQGAGYTNLIEAYGGLNAYSYVFDGQWGYLDHALSNTSLAGQVSAVNEWHINADEPSVLDYNLEFKSPGQQTSLYASDQYRMSDHDSVLIDLELNSAPSNVDAGGPYLVAEGSSVIVTATGSDPDGDSLTYAWDLDDNGSFETPGQSVTFSAGTLDGPGSVLIHVQASDPGGLSASDMATVNISNSAPTASLNAPASTNEGVDFPIALVNSQDPSGADVSAGFSYAFDCGAGYGSFGPAASSTCQALDNGSLPVKVMIKDKDGGQTEYTAIVSVANLPPLISQVTNSGPIFEGGSALVTVTASDPAGAADPLSYAFDCNSDLLFELGPQAGNSASCTFATAGSFTVNVEVTDGDGGVTIDSTVIIVDELPDTFKILQTGQTFPSLQAALDAALGGQTIIPLTAGPFAGESIASTRGVTINLSGATFTGGSSFLIVAADDVRVVGPGVLAGGGNASPAIVVQPGADNFILENVEVNGWTDGVHVAGPVESLKIVGNWIHSNSQAGLQVDGAPSGVVTIEGNLFKVNGGPGVEYNGTGSLKAAYNSWADRSGPTGLLGDGVGPNVVYAPYTFAELYLDMDPATPEDTYQRHAPVTTSLDVALKAEAENLFGISFKFSYDASKLTLNTTTFSPPWNALNCTALNGLPTGQLGYFCSLTSSGEWDGGTIATFNFSALSPGEMFFDLFSDDSLSTGAVGGVKVFVNNAGYNDPSAAARDVTDSEDGKLILDDIANFTGFIDLQGRANDAGALVKVFAESTTTTLLAQGSSASSGKFVSAYLPGKLLVVSTPPGYTIPYFLTVDRALFLPSPAPSVSALLTSSPTTSLALLILLGGDATDNNLIDIADASCIGSAYGGVVNTCSGGLGANSDVNEDGIVNIYDLTLMGGNFDLTNSPWLP